MTCNHALCRKCHDFSSQRHKKSWLPFQCRLQHLRAPRRAGYALRVQVAHKLDARTDSAHAECEGVTLDSVLVFLYSVSLSDHIWHFFLTVVNGSQFSSANNFVIYASIQVSSGQVQVLVEYYKSYYRSYFFHFRFGRKSGRKVQL